MKCLLFTYLLSDGSRVDGFKRRDVQSIIGICSLQENDSYAVSYTLSSDTLGVIPYDDFDTSALPYASLLCVEEVELILRTRIECKLKNHEAGALERLCSQAVLEYRFLPKQEELSGLDLKIDCFLPRPGIYFIVVQLMQGRNNLGIVGARQVRWHGINFQELCLRVDAITEALLPDNLSSLATALVKQCSL